MTPASLIATAFSRIAALTSEGAPILWSDERTGDDAFEDDLASAMPAGWRLIEDEDGDLVAVRA